MAEAHGGRGGPPPAPALTGDGRRSPPTCAPRRGGGSGVRRSTRRGGRGTGRSTQPRIPPAPHAAHAWRRRGQWGGAVPPKRDDLLMQGSFSGD